MMRIPKNLVFFDDENPGYTRKKWGRGFRYIDVNQKPLSSSDEVERVKSLVIPPAWENVWISPLHNGHLQCTGKDVKQRKQYLYHPDWTAYRQQRKFDKIREFGLCLPVIRKAYEVALTSDKWTKRRVVALIVCLLDKHYFRIGNQHYADINETYGLTTLRRKHLQADADQLTLAYKAKSGKHRKIQITDKKITKLLREVSELPGYEIFRYKDSGKYVNIDSSDVNEYLKEITGEDFTAKDFRTWGASKLALEEYEQALDQLAENSRLKFEPTLVKRVAKQMGNTLTVCRQYYIHPDALNFVVEHQPDKLSDYAKAKNIINSEDMSFYENLLLSIIKS